VRIVFPYRHIHNDTIATSTATKDGI
jgi:hypothetical protein